MSNTITPTVFYRTLHVEGLEISIAKPVHCVTAEHMAKLP
jgi:hypothetical protein